MPECGLTLFSHEPVLVAWGCVLPGRRQKTTQVQQRNFHKEGAARALRVVYGPDRAAVGRVIPLVGQPVRLGRMLNPPHVTLDDGNLSRVHAEFGVGVGGCVGLQDLGSTNGTYVNGHAVHAASLDAGDVVRVGNTLLLIDALDPDFDVPAPLQAADAVDPAALPIRFVGPSPAMRRIAQRIARVAPSELSVLILGETGTGKEVVAREVHALSGRTGPFVTADCGAIAPTLIESELFGHARGAFTGATGAATGLFRAATGGTLFLDEVGEVPLDLQTRLLRVLEEGEVRPVGSVQPVQVDVRIVAATNVDLEAAVIAGRFRADLFARLDQLRLTLPPLRARRQDILPLVAHFVGLHGGGTRQLTLTPDAAEALILQPWPFNVRELEKVVRLVMLEHPTATTLCDADLPEAYRYPPPRADAGTGGAQNGGLPATAAGLPAEPNVPDAAELRRLLASYRGSVAALARHFQKDRRQIYRWLHRYGLTPDEARP